jgi:hypothetical protein
MLVWRPCLNAGVSGTAMRNNFINTFVGTRSAFSFLRTISRHTGVSVTLIAQCVQLLTIKVKTAITMAPPRNLRMNLAMGIDG